MTERESTFININDARCFLQFFHFSVSVSSYKYITENGAQEIGRIPTGTAMV